MQSLCLEFTNISNCYNRQFFNSNQYYNIMKTMTFLGVSGEVKFSNGTPDRIADIYYILKNIQPLNIEQKNIDFLSVLKWHIDSTNWTYYKNKSDDILRLNLSKTIPVDCKLIQDRMSFRPVIMIAKPTIEYNELVDGVANGLFDTVMTSVAINTKRSRIVDFSIAIIPRSYRILIRKPRSIQLD
ncbi:unnamed protein product [Rotaria sp. Silwood1]|nr:unnamed protein product [Rotaria sp. Silwood1]CAF4680556.1 unnamed protein product [Rotaria sp. Silwood1]